MTGALGTRRDVRLRFGGERTSRGGDRTALALAAMLFGRGTVADLRACGIDCDLGDVARAADAIPELSIVIEPEGFRCELPADSLADALPRLADDWADLVMRVLGALSERGDYRRVALLLGDLLDAIDLTPFIFRHAFDLLNAGEAELVESVVFDDAFGAPEWLRTALSGVEGLLWAGCRGYPDQSACARETRAFLSGEADALGRTGEELVPMAQAWSMLELYGSWGRRIPAAAELPVDLAKLDDHLLRCLWTLRRARQLMVLGHLRSALGLLDAARGLVAEDSIVGAHLALDHFLCRALLGEPLDAAECRRIRAASERVGELHLDLLGLAVDGYASAVLAFVGAGPERRELERLWERSALHPDPILRAALAIGCAAGAFRRHAFYAALTYVRDLSESIAYLGATDLRCCAYGMEALCLWTLDEEPRPLALPEEGRPSTLGFLPLVRAIYGVSQGVFKLAREIDPQGSAALFDGVEPSYAARTLATLAIKGAWTQARALRDLLPSAWRAPVRPRLPESEAEPGPAQPPLRLVPEVETPVLPRTRLPRSTTPKLSIGMLGSFEIFVGDRRITDDCWRRKASKTLLQALVVAPGHTISRASLCELIWPDHDFLASRNHLYTVLSSTRDSLGCVNGAPLYLICEQGKVSLNAKLTECDIDIFEDRCRSVLSREGDAPWRLSLCRELGRQYGSGLYVPSQDVRGDFQARRQALDSLFVDTLVEAADLSLKEGLAKEALWFSRDARDHDELREDVVAAYLRALAADGRGKELRAAYKGYCTRFSAGRLVAPPARIRTLYEGLVRYVEEDVPPRDESIRAFEEALGNVA